MNIQEFIILNPYILKFKHVKKLVIVVGMDMNHALIVLRIQIIQF